MRLSSRGAVLFQIVLILENVGVHQQRLAAACGAPVRDLVELRPGLDLLIEGVIWSVVGLPRCRPRSAR